MTDQEREKRIRALQQRFEEVEEDFIEIVAKQIKAIGELNASSINRIRLFAAMNEDMGAIHGKIARAAERTVPDLMKLYQAALDDEMTDPRFKDALANKPLSDVARARIDQVVKAIGRQTADQMVNLSNTTAVNEAYRNAVDKGILAVTSGLGDYKSMTRQALRDLGGSGLQVQYESGYRRRLDTAVRQNIVDGVKQIQQQASDMISEDLGFDAKEISVHANSAPDHEPVQGCVFLNEEFEKLQTDQDAVDIDGKTHPAMRRPIGEWNCMHFAMGFSTKSSKRKYTPEQLEEFRRKNAEGCEIDGRHYTLYEARQLMRQIETKIRQEKDTAIAARAAGDDELRQECQRKINALSEKYGQVAEQSGLAERRERMQVDGFKAVKVKDDGNAPAPTPRGSALAAKVEQTAKGGTATEAQTDAGKALTDGQIGFKKDADPIRKYLGSASSSHPEMVERITQELQSKGVKTTVEDSREVMGYFPSTTAGKPGEFKVSRDASISAWLHEQQHARDDEESGWRGSRIVWDTEQSIAWEQRAYQKEIDFAQKLGYTDVVDELHRLLREEIERRRE